MNDKIFVDGCKIEVKKSVYGDIIKVGLYVPNFEQFMKKYVSNNGWLDFDILDKNGGGKYACLNNHKLQQQAEVSRYGTEEDLSEQIPF